MTAVNARELLKAARTAQAETGPGTGRRLPRPRRRRPPADPLRARQPLLQVQAHYPAERGTARQQHRTGRRAREPPRPGRAAGRPGNAGRQPGRRCRRHARPRAASSAGRGGAAGARVMIWHSVAFDDQGRHTAMLDGYQPGDPVVRVVGGGGVRDLQHPRDHDGADLARAYYGRRLRSPGFPRKEAVLPQVVVSAAVTCCPDRRGTGWLERTMRARELAGSWWS